MHAFVSGATGFIGGKLLASLVNSGINVRVLVRPAATHTKACSWPSTQVNVVSGDLTEPASLRNILDGVDCLFHLAGYAHAEDANSDAAGSLHRRVTVEGTRALVAEAKRAGVKHFIFVSSVKAMGEGSDSLLDEAAAAQPTTQYGRAKLEAEHLVLEAGATSAMLSCK